jgi:hypothetical protein
MAFKSIAADELYQTDLSRKYRELEKDLFVLETEAQDVRMNERKTVSIAYKIIEGGFRHYDKHVVVTEIKNKKRLKEISDLI